MKCDKDNSKEIKTNKEDLVKFLPWFVNETSDTFIFLTFPNKGFR